MLVKRAFAVRWRKRARGSTALLLLMHVMVFASAASAEIPAKLVAALSASSPKVRIVAIAGVAKSKDPAAATLLKPLLADSDATVRAATVDAFGNLLDPLALDVLAPMRTDADPTVQQVLARVLPALEAQRVVVDVGELQDITNGQVPGLITALQDKVKAAIEVELGSRVVVKRGGVAKGYGVIIGLRHVKPVKDGANTLLEVRCEMTLVELPGKILRVSSNATASAGVEGALPKAMERELAQDAVTACAPSLAKDFADYARPRMHR